MPSSNKYEINSAYDSIAVTQSTSPWVIGDGGGSITVDAVALDIRPLTAADVVTAQQGTSPWVVSGTVELGATTLAALENITVDAVTGTVTVQATNLDIRDLAFATDKVDVSGSSVSITGAVSALSSYSAWNTIADVSIPTTAGGTAVFASPSANRRAVLLQNVGNNDCRVSYTNNASSTRGYFLKRGGEVVLEVESGADVFAIGIGGSTTLAASEYIKA